MKKLFSTLLILFMIYYAFEIAFNIFGVGHSLNYIVNTNGELLKIEENYIARQKGEIKSYNIEIIYDDEVFHFSVFKNLYGSRKIVKDVHVYSGDDYKCVFPVFMNNYILTDALCLKNKIYYHATNIDSKSVALFLDELENAGYDKNLFLDDRSNTTVNGVLTVFENNLISNHFVSMNHYRGIYTINHVNLKTVYIARMFSTDVYKRDISILVNNFYITANYDQKFAFDKFLVVDITNNRSFEIRTGGFVIDFDSYIQGVVGDSVYLFDKQSRKQYEINTKLKTVVEVGNVDIGIRIYNSDSFDRVPASEVVRNMPLFKNDIISSSKTGEYERIDRTPGEKTGYIYFYKKTSKGFDVYRTPKLSENTKTYLFSTNKIDNIKYIDGFIYYTSGIDVKHYSDLMGNKTLARNTEFDFNSSLYFNVYRKQG
jgi:hypothetical protein